MFINFRPTNLFNLTSSSSRNSRFVYPTVMFANSKIQTNHSFPLRLIFLAINSLSTIVFGKAIIPECFFISNHLNSQYLFKNLFEPRKFREKQLHTLPQVHDIQTSFISGVNVSTLCCKTDN